MSDLQEMAKELKRAIELRDRAAECDAQRGQFFGEGFQTGRAYVGEVHSLLRG